MVPFFMIAAVDENFGIGKDGRMPWHVSGDLKHFSRVTTRTSRPGLKNAVIMGRKTWESIPPDYQPLPQRVNLVLTRDKDYYLPRGVEKFNALDQALLSLSKQRDEVESVFVIGGGQVFGDALRHPLCKKIYLTHILKDFACDTFFPRDLALFREIARSDHQEEGSVKYYFSEYIRSGVSNHL